jgi:hypothetical protein
MPSSTNDQRTARKEILKVADALDDLFDDDDADGDVLLDAQEQFITMVREYLGAEDAAEGESGPGDEEDDEDPEDTDVSPNPLP